MDGVDTTAGNGNGRGARTGRPARSQAVMRVVERTTLSPHTVRVVVGGDGFAAFRDNEFTDKYVKLTFVDPGLGLEPPYDLDALRADLPPEQRPVTRTYTVRRVDPERRELTLDFVVHGDEGVAAPWARAAEPGDVLVLSGAGGGYRPDPAYDHHVLLGDESALPAINAAVETLPDTARGTVLVETSDPDQTLDVTAPPGVEIQMLHRATPGSRPELLAHTLQAMPWPAGAVDVFAHGERESMKAVRAVLKSRQGDADRVSLSGYWAHGRTEDRFQAEKREPIGRLDG